MWRGVQGPVTALIATSCGWRFGVSPTPSISAGRVDGATVELGLLADLRGSLVSRLAELGSATGSPLDLHVVGLDHAAEWATPGEGVAVMRSTLRVAWSVGQCTGEVGATRRWTMPTGHAAEVIPLRAEVVRTLAADAVAHAVDAVAAAPCP